jgi:hypothetical protein
MQEVQSERTLCEQRPPAIASGSFLPAAVLAAAVAGLQSMISAFLLPMRPGILRLLVDRQTSPSPSTPWCAPAQTAQPLGINVAPASSSVARSPLRALSTPTARDAGTTSRRTSGWTRLFRKILAAIARSSTRALVQEPMNTCIAFRGICHRALRRQIGREQGGFAGFLCKLVRGFCAALIPLPKRLKRIPDRPSVYIKGKLSEAGRDVASRPRCLDVPVALRLLAMGEETLRHDEMQFVLGPGHRGVKSRRSSSISAEVPTPRSDGMQPNAQNEDRFPFLALGGMNGRVDQVILSSSGTPA